ncbi:serine/threonine-protein kinase [Asanoa sp. NPDC049573]|uniref:serine/threonine-protein kinase n=1 Tax=Asanoa sp. NPDC049573 TaxID=3155396 RepID=UPI003433B627
MAWLRMGTTFLRRYVLLGPIARGGVSTVYHGFDSHSARPLAVKVITPAHPDAAGREAAITERLRHPSVPRVYDHGAAPLPDGSVAPYVVLELLDGVALAGRLVGGPLPWPEAVRIAATLADVLAVAHRRGFVHRDVSARNVMLTRAGAKMIDFGLAGPSGAPGLPADDVFALGVLLHRMLTGPGPGEDRRRTAPAPVLTGPGPGEDRRRTAPAPVLSVPGLPRAVAELCRASMTRTPADRPCSADVAIGLWSSVMPASAPAPRALPAPALHHLN